jgi:hypothetical protein
MGFMGKLRNRLVMSKSRAKQKKGRAANNRNLIAKVLADRVEGAGRQVGEQVKDTGKNAWKAFRK